MDRIRANNSSSRNVVSYGWEPNGNPMVGILEVEFSNPKGNSVYQYQGVPRERWLALLQAPSAGQFINSQIKPFYPALRVQ
jgi:hypothetical protein